MVYNHIYSFEFDLTKSRTNKKKHGIDFIEAQEIWKYSHIEFSLRTIGETRWAVIGQIGGIFWTAIITKRKNNFRIISVRRSRHEEKQAFENTFQEKD